MLKLNVIFVGLVPLVSREGLEEHVRGCHQDPSEDMLIEGFEKVDEGIMFNEERSNDTEYQKGHIEAKVCPTPIPESIYICAECSSGFYTNDEVEKHMSEFHEQETLQEIIKRLECELRLEKGQHKDHLEMLKDSLKEASIKRIYIESLERKKV